MSWVYSKEFGIAGPREKEARYNIAKFSEIRLEWCCFNGFLPKIDMGAGDALVMQRRKERELEALTTAKATPPSLIPFSILLSRSVPCKWVDTTNFPTVKSAPFRALWPD